MGAVTFDTLKFVRKLESVGVPTAQAEIQAQVFAEAMDDVDVATKSDIRQLETKTEGRFVLLQWMIGFNLAMTAAILWKLIGHNG